MIEVSQSELAQGQTREELAEFYYLNSSLTYLSVEDVTTTSGFISAGAEFEVGNRNVIKVRVQNTGAASVTAKIVGRLSIKDSSNAVVQSSDWEDVHQQAVISAGSGYTFLMVVENLEENVLDVHVKSSAPASPSTVDILVERTTIRGGLE